jgi:hypothetical protein
MSIQRNLTHADNSVLSALYRPAFDPPGLHVADRAGRHDDYPSMKQTEDEQPPISTSETMLEFRRRLSAFERNSGIDQGGDRGHVRFIHQLRWSPGFIERLVNTSQDSLVIAASRQIINRISKYFAVYGKHHHGPLRYEPPTGCGPDFSFRQHIERCLDSPFTCHDRLESPRKTR